MASRLYTVQLRCNRDNLSIRIPSNGDANRPCTCTPGHLADEWCHNPALICRHQSPSLVRRDVVACPLRVADDTTAITRTGRVLQAFRTHSIIRSQNTTPFRVARPVELRFPKRIIGASQTVRKSLVGVARLGDVNACPRAVANDVRPSVNRLLRL